MAIFSAAVIGDGDQAGSLANATLLPTVLPLHSHVMFSKESINSPRYAQRYPPSLRE